MEGETGATLSGVPMTVLTILELEFLADLRLRWRELYLDELARLLREHDGTHLLQPPTPPSGRLPDAVAVDPRAGDGH